MIKTKIINNWRLEMYADLKTCVTIKYVLLLLHVLGTQFRCHIFLGIIDLYR